MSDPNAAPEDMEPVKPSPPAGVPKKSGSSGSIALVVAALVAVGGLAFAGGRLTAPASTPTIGSGFPGGFPGGFPRGSFAPGDGIIGLGQGGLTLRGEVTSLSADAITIRLEDGTSVTVPLDDQTTYHRSSAGQVDDVIVGSTVAIEPGGVTTRPGASFDPGEAASLSLGPASDVTVVDQ